MSDQERRILRLVGESEESGDTLLSDVRAFLSRFCVFPDTHSLNAVTLWAAHTHVIEAFYSTPRLAILSAELGSGKTRVLEILALLTYSPMFAFNASPPTIYRRLAEQPMTLLFDEVDTVFTKRGKDDENADLRALLNAGYKRGAVVPRCVGTKHEVVDFAVFCPVALAGIGDLPDTVMSRSVIVRMRRRAPDETVEPYRGRFHDTEGQALQARLHAWAGQIEAAVTESVPELPEGIVDRPAEVWEPLVAIADQAGGDWPQRARDAAVALCRVAEDRRVSLGVRLLADLRTVFEGDDKLSTATIIERLTAGDGLDDDAPWGDLRGKPIDSRRIAGMLRPFGIKSKNIPVGRARPKGYTAEDLHDAWTRYLPATPASPLHALLPLKANNHAGFEVADENVVADTSATSDLSATKNHNENNNVADVAQVADLRGTGGSCPRCRGEGCGHCGDTGRNPEAV